MNLITDRTARDVALGTEKGSYGATDLNRVEMAVQELLQLAQGLDLQGPWNVKTNWDLPETFGSDTWVTAEQMVRYLDNVRKLCQEVKLVAALPESMNRLTYEGANQIEQALYLVEKRILNILEIFRFSGEFYAGEENYL